MSEFCLPQPPRRQKIIYDETQELDPDFAKFYKETQDIVNDVLMKEGGVLFQEITDENEVSSQWSMCARWEFPTLSCHHLLHPKLLYFLSRWHSNIMFHVQEDVLKAVQLEQPQFDESSEYYLDFWEEAEAKLKSK